ncbi:MAG: TIGR02147 family protein [Oligoflexia bacterium]|nr:TIGR02147 family protein [Oligoflexia bacterium]
MTEKTIFDFTDYKSYLKHFEASNAQLQKGFRSRMAEQIGCQSAFVSQVLNGKANLSLEQALKLRPFLKLNSTERDYFLWMIEFGRAGTDELKTHFLSLMTELRERHLKILNRVTPERILTQEAQNTYYSQWYYAAIHILCTIPEFGTIESIARALRLTPATVRDAAVFLVKLGLLKETKGKLRPGSTQLHLDRSSLNIARHHTHWRLKAIQSLEAQKATDTHYSTVSSLSVADAEVLRGRLVALIEEYAKTVKPSREETLYCFNLDFFSLIG